MNYKLIVTALSLGAVVVPLRAKADSFAAKCPDIPTCAKVVGDLLGQKYLFDSTVKGSVLATANLELTQENAELLFTTMLNSEGFSRVPLGGSDVKAFQIMRQRDARDAAIPVVDSDQRTVPKLPVTYDLMTMRYHATHKDIVEHIARLARSFMPGNSRIIPDSVAGTLLITDTAMNLKKLYGLIQDSDQAASPEIKKQWQEEHKREQDAWVRRSSGEHPVPTGREHPDPVTTEAVKGTPKN